MGVKLLSVSIVCTFLSIAGLQYWTDVSMEKYKSDSLIINDLINSENATSALELLLGSYTTLVLVASFAINLFITVILGLKMLFFSELSSSELRKLLERLVNYIIYKDPRKGAMATTRSEAQWDVLERLVITSRENVNKMQEVVNAMKANLVTVNKSLSQLSELNSLVEIMIREKAYERPETEAGYVPEGVEESLKNPAKGDEGEAGGLLTREADEDYELIHRYSGRKATNPFEALASLRQGDRSVEDRMGEVQIQEGTKGRYDLPPLLLGRNEDVSGPANKSTHAQQSTGQTLVNTSGSGRTGGSLGEVVVNWKWMQNGKPITVGFDYNGQDTSSPSFLTSPNQFVDKIPDQKNDALSQEIACYMDLELKQIKIKRFADGEIYVQLQETVIPYFGYARADRKAQGRESIAAKLEANLITEAGADRVLACDLHSGQSMGYFDIPVDHVHGLPVIFYYLASKTKCSDDLVVVSPDVGGVARARAFAKKLSDAPGGSAQSGQNVVHPEATKRYGGLAETITSLSVISSAAAGGAATFNVLALGVASLVGGFFVIVNNLWELRNECIEQSFDNNVSPEVEQRDRYKQLLGRKENFVLHAIISTQTYIIFGLVASVTHEGTFLPLVVPPTIFQAGLWSTWLAVLCFLKMFQAISRDRLERLNASPSATPGTYFRVYSALLLVFVLDVLWILLCLTIYSVSSSSISLLLFFEPSSIGFETLQAIVVHGFQLLEIWLHHYARDGANCRLSKIFDISPTGSLEEWKGFLIRNLGFFLDIMTLLMALAHYLYIWWLHGMAFHLVDAILCLNIRALLSATVKRVRGFVKLRIALGTLHGALPDATLEDLRAYDDECAICREPMAKAKKLPCGHLFHLACLRSWLDQGLSESYSCPTCRKPLFTGSAESGINTTTPDMSRDEELARQMSTGIDRPNIPGHNLHPGVFPNQSQNAEAGDWSGTGVGASWLGLDGASPSGFGRVQMVMRQLAAVGETYAQTALEDATWSLFPPNSSQAGTSRSAVSTGSTRYPRGSGGLHLRSTSLGTNENLANIIAMAETVREVLPHIPDEIIFQKLHELESELADVYRIPLDPLPGPRHRISFDDVVQRIGFLKNLLSLEEVTSPLQNPGQLHDIAEKIAALEAAFYEWDESRTSALSNCDDTLSICSDCTHAMLNDGVDSEHVSETPVSAAEDLDGEKWPENCFEEAQKPASVDTGAETPRVSRRFGNYFGIFGSGVIVGAICMANLSSFLSMVDAEAFLLPPT
ncbi:hypothetical protein F511_12146 [Dorcoceras hygrometricum]|uniref:RING-type domain-containing protein n=1 Tax=Dorcoceras hygrometricum TaxID=472368 RepID=A0A2Z7CAR0_9LAMI|nr:hypothetical protein F511_12146 [Dorcoceras hygrometricum]